MSTMRSILNDGPCECLETFSFIAANSPKTINIWKHHPWCQPHHRSFQIWTHEASTPHSCASWYSTVSVLQPITDAKWLDCHPPTMESQCNAGKCMRLQSATASEFEQLRLAIMNQGNGGGSSQTQDHQFCSHFGVTPKICAHVWDLLDPIMLPRDAEKKYLLWALMFVMLYKTEIVHCMLAGGVDGKTFYSWAFFLSMKFPC